MKLLYKRILILFSIALNVGFIIMTFTTGYHHYRPFHKNWLKLADTVHQLDLPDSEENDVLDTIKKFRDVFDQHHLAIKQGRKEIMQVLAKTGPLDQVKLHQLLQATDQHEKRKNEIFEAHVVELRHRLGDEKGAQFFSLLLQQLDAEDRRSHR